MKIKRNNPCPCGSGKKYKKCCMGKADDENYKNIDRLQGNMHKSISQSKIKQCIHPNSEECKGKIINAHSIQNNKILNKLAEAGHVFMLKPDIQNSIMDINTKSESRNKATTFTGFCKYHDDVVFKDIENKSFLREEKQIFLFAYRAFALEYHKKMEATKMIKSTFAKMPNSGMNSGLLDIIKGHDLAIQDNNKIKQIFDKSILSDEFNILDSIVWELDYEIGFSTTTMFGLEYDLEGNLLNDITSTEDERMKNIFLTIFPEDAKSYVIISWLKEDSEVYKGFKEQAQKLGKEDKIIFLNNLIVNYTENIAISPRLWNKWSEEVQNELKEQFVLDFTIFRDFMNCNLLNQTKYNLFEKISE